VTLSAGTFYNSGTDAVSRIGEYAATTVLNVNQEAVTRGIRTMDRMANAMPQIDLNALPDEELEDERLAATAREGFISAINALEYGSRQGMAYLQGVFDLFHELAHTQEAQYHEMEGVEMTQTRPPPIQTNYRAIPPIINSSSSSAPSSASTLSPVNQTVIPTDAAPGYPAPPGYPSGQFRAPASSSSTASPLPGYNTSESDRASRVADDQVRYVQEDAVANLVRTAVVEQPSRRNPTRAVANVPEGGYNENVHDSATYYGNATAERPNFNTGRGTRATPGSSQSSVRRPGETEMEHLARTFGSRRRR
jgi:hypothetical protein